MCNLLFLYYTDSALHKVFEKTCAKCLVQNSALCSGGDQLRVSREVTGGDFRLSGLPLGSALGKLVVGNHQGDRVVRDVDFDHVALLDQSDRTADRRFGRDVTDGCTSCRAGKTSVGNQRDGAAETSAHDSGGGVEHFAHAGAALGTFIADDNNVAFDDIAAVDGSHCVLLAVIDLRGSGVLEHFGSNRGALDDAAVGSKVAAENGNAARGAVGIVDGTDDFGVLVDNTCDVLGNCLAGAGDEVGVEQTELVDLVHDGIDAACLVEILHVGSARGSKVAEVRSMGADFVGDVEVEVDTALMRDSREVKHGVGAAAERHIHCQRVAERSSSMIFMPARFASWILSE